MMGGFLNSTWPQRFMALPWMMILTVGSLGVFAVVILYSAAGGSMTPWATNHAIRFTAFTGLAILLSQVDLKTWLKWSYAIYGFVLLALLAVEVLGKVSGGAQRWLDLGFIRIQPSELMKLALVLALARFYHYLPRGYASKFAGLWPPLVMIGLPCALVLLQPDLGTTLVLAAGGVVMLFLGGIPLSWILIPGGLIVAAVPFLINLLHDYQKRRIMIFLDPEADPLGAGYHITQSKIAIGSGGVFGKGYMNGSQSHLQYLPEQHTDFVFATMAEEWGLMGGMIVLTVFGIFLNWALRVGMQCQNIYGRLLAGGLSMAIFFYILINCMMVMGWAPVVGIPFPLLSYGGSAMMTVMIAFGILMGVHRQRAADDF